MTLDDLFKQDSERLLSDLKRKLGADPFAELNRLGWQEILSEKPLPKNMGENFLNHDVLPRPHILQGQGMLQVPDMPQSPYR